MGKGKKKQNTITREEVWRARQENHERWADVVDRAEFVANELNAVAYLIACAESDFGVGVDVCEGIFSIIERGADTIHELQALATRLARQQA